MFSWTVFKNYSLKKNARTKAQPDLSTSTCCKKMTTYLTQSFQKLFDCKTKRNRWKDELDADIYEEVTPLTREILEEHTRKTNEQAPLAEKRYRNTANRHVLSDSDVSTEEMNDSEQEQKENRSLLSDAGYFYH